MFTTCVEAVVTAESVEEEAVGAPVTLLVPCWTRADTLVPFWAILATM